MQAFEKQIIRSANFFNLRPSDFLTKILSGNILGMLGGSPTSPTNLNPFTGFSSTPAFQMKKITFCACYVLPALLTLGALARKPNVIVIMADDLGYGDLGCYGAKPKNLKPPHIDRLAREGLKFTSGYCSASTCTPTRYSFLTGTYAFRGKNTGIAPPSSPLIIPEETYTLPDLLKQAGYKTAVVGKWHLGLGAQDPLWVGMKKPSEDHPTGITHRDTLKMDWTHGHNSTIHNGISRIGFYTGGHAARFRDEDLADKWVEKSKEWIGRNKDQPFFLFFASHDLHVPRIPHERFRGTSALSYRGDVIVQLDWCVGEIVKCLKKEGLEKDTMIVFCADNGPVGDDGYADEALEKMGDHRAAGPYSGGKYSIFEGGSRTPFITYWP